METEDEKQKRRLEKLLKSGASQRILEDSLRSTRPVPNNDMERESQSGSYGGLLGGILRLASNLDRPAGAVRAGVLGNNPVEGFKNPEDYSLVDPNDNPFMRFMGGAAEAILDPLNLVGAKWMSPLARESSFLTRVAAEGGVNLAARQASEFAAENIPEDANPWLRGLGPLAAGIAGGAGATGAIRGARGLRGVQPEDIRQTPVEQLVDAYPEARFAEVTGYKTDISPQALEDVLKTQEENAQIAAFGMNAKKIREAAQNAAESGTDELPTLEISEGLKSGVKLLDDRLSRFSEFSRRYADNDADAARAASRLSQERVANLPDAVKIKGMPGWAAQTINGKINRSPLAHQSAILAHAYEETQKINIADVHTGVGKLTDELFGKYVDKVSIKSDAPMSARGSFDRARSYVLQQGKKGEFNHNAIDQIIENPEYFNLSPAQNQFLDGVQNLLRQSDEVSRDVFGVPITEIEGNYGPRAHFLEHADHSALQPEEQLRLLGTEKTFQQHRLFDTAADIVEASMNPEYFKNRIRSIISNSDDPEEIARLQDILQSDLIVSLKPATFADALADRLMQGANLRAEKLALKMVRENGGGAREIREVESLIKASKITDAIGIPAEAAALLRQAVLSADFSILGTHSIGEIIMGGGFRGVISSFVKSVGSEEGYAAAMASRADGAMKAAQHGLELATEDFMVRDDSWLHKPIKVGQKRLVDPVTGKKTDIKVGGTDVNFLGQTVRKLDQVQYGRMVKFWKLDTYENTFSLMTAARDGHTGITQLLDGHPGVFLGKITGQLNKTDDELGRAAADFTNNLFGGLNRVNGGRTATHNLLESLFILTPGFTRGTMNIGLQTINPLRWDAEAALSRDFAVRGLVLAGSVITGLSMMFNGPDAPLPNITDPSKDDWMVLSLPGGKSIKPLARWRSPGKIVGETVMTALQSGPLEAAQYFGPQALNWGTYRQSGLISAGLGDPVGMVAESQFGRKDLGNQFSRGLGLWDLFVNPEVNQGRQVGEAIVKNLMPATGQNILETYREDGSLTGQGLKNIGFTFATEFLGVNSQGPSMLTQAVVAKGADWAANHGMSSEAIQLAVANNRNPITAKDETGRYIFDGATRKAGVEALSAELGIDTDAIYRNGKLSDREKKSTLQAIKDNQTSAYFEGMDLANANYATKMGQAQQAFDQGLVDGPGVSSFISKARQERAAEKGMVEQLNPAALVFLQSPDQLAKKNSKDLLLASLSAEYYRKEFFDPETLSFDYDAQNAWLQELRGKYPTVFDEWQQRQEENKTPLEKKRDAAFDVLDTYFQVGDEVWQRLTGGALGKNEKAFDGYLREMLRDNGVEDPGAVTYLTSQIKSNLEPVKRAKSITQQLRDIMRAADPELEDAVVTWLGNQPIQTKKLSRNERARINQLLLRSQE